MSRRVHLPRVDIKGEQAPRKPLDAQAAGLMLIFCLALGLQQVAIKSIIGDVSPLAQIAIRSPIAAILVVILTRWRHIDLFVPNHLGPGLIIGIGYTLEFTFVAVGLNYTYAAHMSVFLYTAPVFAAVGLHLFVPGEQLAMRHWLGVVIAFGGLLLALAPSGSDISGRVLFGDALGVCAGLCWAAGTLALRTSALSEAPPLRAVAYQLIVASVLLLPAAALLGDLSSIHMTPLAWASLSFQAFAVTFGALLVWFWLLRRYLASRLGIFAFLSPIFGVGFGVVLMGDPISVNFAIGGLAILVGLVLVNTPGRTRAKAD